MTIIMAPNSTSSLWPSMCLASVDPRPAPTTPASVNTAAHGHFTLPARAWATRLLSALTDTASALVPIATCGGETPTP